MASHQILTMVPNETTSSMTRKTKDGRTLQYQMTVVQQPERARACGAGAKSSADRRPVDPPPIVELRILEGVGEEKKDITFTHEANFFLFTTLEHARPMNQGRVPVTASTLAVLTGTAVAGMAYLDRPKPAGYFIFPDLSIRHEGKYRLSFNLYEELKNPEKDADLGSPTQSPRLREKGAGGNPSGPRNFVHFRLEVKSTAFSVFSAKRFPGLAESTELSRLVNEQGCRVRIRRDVRMRRRDKVSDGFKDVGDDGPHPSPLDPFQAVQHTPDRPRSTSNASVEVASSYGIDRRSSVHDMKYYPTAPSYQQAPPPPQSASAYTSHLSFGAANTPHYSTPTMSAHPPMAHPYQQAYTYTPQNHTRQISGPQNYGYAAQPSQATSYVPPPYVDERPYPDSRRSSGGMSVGRAQPTIEPYDQGRQPAQVSATGSQLRSLTPLNTGAANQGPLPPIKTLVHHSPMEPPTSEPKSASSAMTQGPPNPFSTSGYTSGAYHNQPPSLPQTANHASTHQSKRTYGSVFDSSHVNQPMHSGMRPNTAMQSHDLPQIETADGELTDAYAGMEELTGPLIYKRADGSRRAKKCPSPRDSSRYLPDERLA